MRTAFRLWSVVLSAILVAQAAAQEPDYSKELPRIDPTPAERALETFQVKTGYRIELAASEPLVASPVAVCWDEQGRMYAVEMRGYSEHREEGISRIRLLYDDNSDGVYDRAELFADKLLWPTAIYPWEGGVFVADAPDILYLKDTNDDGVADVRQRVYTGFGTQNVQGLLNSFHWHFDNRIHGTASSNGGEITVVDKPEVKPVSVRGRDFSFDPRTFDFRAESGGAQHGMSFDDFGRKFVCSNSDHAQQVMFEDRYLARNPLLAAPSARVSIASDGPQAEVFRISPVEPWRIVRTRLRVSGSVPGPIEGGGRAAGYFTGATGVTVVRGSAFKDDPLRGMLVVGDVGSNLIHRKKLVLKGVQYEASRVDEQSELVASKDNWFRPAQFANGPDGALYVVDVYREVIEHPHSIPPVIKKHLDLDSGRDRGRIYRIAPHGWRPTLDQRLDKLTTKQLAAMLNHDNAWHRETASRLLYERQSRDAAEVMVSIARSEGVTAAGRIHALYGIAGQGLLEARDILAALDDPDPRVREHAVRMAEPLATIESVSAKLVKMVDDPDPFVRYQLAFSLGEMPAEQRTPPLVQLLNKYGNDRWLQTACFSSLGGSAEGALVELVKINNGGSVTLAKSLAALVSRQGPESMARAVKSFSSLSPKDHPALSHVLLAFEKQGRARSVDWEKVLQPPQRQAMQAILSDARQLAEAMVLDAQQPAANRIAALEFLTLADFGEVKPCFEAGLAPQSPRELRLASLRTLSEFSDPAVSMLLLDHWPSFTPEARRAAVDVYLSRPQRVQDLLKAVQGEQIPGSEVDRTQVEVLKKHADANVRNLAVKLFGATARRADIVEQYRPVLETKGDAIRGKELFVKNCSGCHRVEGVGHELGPNLAAMKNRGPEAILLNVLDPNREVNPQYLSYVVATMDGRTLSGVIAGESAASVTLKRADGQGDEVLRSEIEELRSTGVSIMPEGMEKQLDQQALADVISYLMSLK